MSATTYPFQMAGGVPVVTTPAEIDMTTAGQLRAVLFEWHTRGHATVVVDMTGTQFCDSAGLRELVRAHKRARAKGGELRLVLPADGAVPRVFTVTGLDHLIPHFAALEQAPDLVPTATGRPRRRGLHQGSLAGPTGSPAEAWEQGAVADSRACEQCGIGFVPQREHARFCSADCRAAWNREHMGDPAVEASALQWSVTAMSEATGRLAEVKVWDRPRAFAAIGETVWWITMVDATLVRHHPGLYDAARAARGPAGELIDQTLAGLRFVRNWMGRDGGLSELIETGGLSTGNRRITRWTWKPAPEPVLASFPPRGRAWEMARYRAYQAHLVGDAIGQTFGRAVTFLTLTGANAASATVISTDAQC
jgi:anti-sigma B factor antagonist